MKIKKYSEHFEVFEELKEGTKRPKAYMEVDKFNNSVNLRWVGYENHTIFKLNLFKYQIEELKEILDFALEKLKEKQDG